MTNKTSLQPLFDFLGYGNPAGRFWFIGMEERGAETDDGLALELDWRRTFQPIEDLMQAHAKWVDFKSDEPFDPTKLVRTWSVMCKLVLCISGHSDWSSIEAVRVYQANRLGRRDGE